MTNLLLTPDPTTASVLVQVTAAPIDTAAPLVEQRRNLLANPSLETAVTGYSVVDFSGTGRLTAVRDTTVGLYGTSSLRATRTGTPGGFISSGAFPVTAGQPYTASVYVKATAGTAPTGYNSAAVGVQWLDSTSTPMGTTLSAYSAVTVGGDWQRIAVTGTAPTGAVTAAVNVFDQFTTATYYLDGWLAEQTGSLQPYFDGSFTAADAPYSTYAWTGTAHASAATFSVRIGADGPITLTRVDANGARPVRLLPNQTTVNGVLTVRDYEAAMVGGVRYDVLDSQQVTTSASVTLGATGPVLHSVVLPQYRVSPTAVTAYDAQRDNSSTVHEIIGRADPVVTKGPMGLRTGTLRLYSASHADARAIEAVASLGEVVMLRQPDHVGLDQYLIPTQTKVSPDTNTANGWTWAVDVTFVEVAAPTSPLMGAVGWTLSGVASAFATLGSIRSTYPTFADLAVGPS